MAWHGWTKTVKEARKLVGEALSVGTVSEQWKQRACKLLGIKESSKP